MVQSRTIIPLTCEVNSILFYTEGYPLLIPNSSYITEWSVMKFSHILEKIMKMCYNYLRFLSEFFFLWSLIHSDICTYRSHSWGSEGINNWALFTNILCFLKKNSFFSDILIYITDMRSSREKEHLDIRYYFYYFSVKNAELWKYISLTLKINKNSIEIKNKIWYPTCLCF